MQWNAVIFGPADTPFEDGTFKLTISKISISYEMMMNHDFRCYLTRLSFQLSQKSTQISHLQCDSSVKCFIQMYMRMEVRIIWFEIFVWIESKFLIFSYDMNMMKKNYAGKTWVKTQSCRIKNCLILIGFYRLFKHIALSHQTR